MSEQEPSGLPDDRSRDGAVYYRRLSDGQDISVYPMIRCWKVCLSKQGSLEIDRYYEYVSLATALDAAREWDGNGRPLAGWQRSSEDGRERYYAAADGGGAPNDHIVSSITVTFRGAHDRVRLWNRGGLAGELVMVEGDGVRLAATLGLVERA